MNTNLIANLNAIGVVVSDMAASHSFYAKLGLQFTFFGDDHAEATTAGGGFKLMLDSESMVRSSDPHWTRGGGSAPFSLAFQMPSPEAVDALFAELVAGGARVHREPWDADWGQRYAVLLDPDGNAVDLYCPLKTG